MNPSTTPQEIFESRMIAIHRRVGRGDDSMDVRHEEFVAMAEAFLGPDFDPVKLAQVEAQQVTLHTTQSELGRALALNRIDRSQYLAEVNRIHAEVAERCESILGAQDFLRLFGVPEAGTGPYIDEETFLSPLSQRRSGSA